MCLLFISKKYHVYMSLKKIHFYDYLYLFIILVVVFPPTTHPHFQH